MQACSIKIAEEQAAVSGNLPQEIGHYFSASSHQLFLLAHAPQVLEAARNDFRYMSAIRIAMAPGNLFDPAITEKVYRSLKGVHPFISPRYWEHEMSYELECFREGATVLAMLEHRYSRRFATTCPGLDTALSIVVSRAGSPFMAVYRETKMMIYNFAVDNRAGQRAAQPLQK